MFKIFDKLEISCNVNLKFLYNSRYLIKNLVVSYFTVKNDKRMEVLKIIANFLDFNGCVYKFHSSTLTFLLDTV